MAVADFEEQWDESWIAKVENNLLQGVFGCRTTEAVEAALTYAKYLSSIGITPENYPVFLKMLEIENHWVIDALIGERDPFLMLSPVQPNRFIVHQIFTLMTKWQRGSIYYKNMSVILGVLQSVYSSPQDGYRIYPLRITDLNALAKHLVKENGQDDQLNRVILGILNNLTRLEGEGDSDMEEVAIHATAIRNAFFDNRKQMEEVIPKVLLVAAGDRTEIPPRKMGRVAAAPSIGKSGQNEERSQGIRSKKKVAST